MPPPCTFCSHAAPCQYTAPHFTDTDVFQGCAWRHFILRMDTSVIGSMSLRIPPDHCICVLSHLSQSCFLPATFWHLLTCGFRSLRAKSCGVYYFYINLLMQLSLIGNHHCFSDIFIVVKLTGLSLIREHLKYQLKMTHLL